MLFFFVFPPFFLCFLSKIVTNCNEILGGIDNNNDFVVRKQKGEKDKVEKEEVMGEGNAGNPITE